MSLIQTQAYELPKAAKEHVILCHNILNFNRCHSWAYVINEVPAKFKFVYERIHLMFLHSTSNERALIVT